ncbi:unnamed protein product [Anisakis simplex]|uniref:Fatty-acid amide hydrolase 2 (inferred by orthology to a human protein) n=1 Tax=Anisakis simplex TaxID=6269 RepID=A0A0M3JYM5_ANISI|nr:unnamed protein product [Anisakis simplex]
MIINRELKSEELIEAYIERIEHVNGIVNAVVQKNFENARKSAKEVDRICENLESGSDEFNELLKNKPLLGVPFTLKDCIEVDGLKCTIGISSRKDLVSNKDAEVVKRMKNAGAIILAVTNVPEVCMWWESVNSIYGRTKNPYDTRLISGGSSGGEACLISSAGSVIGLGSDIGGSIRIPAYFNGVFGLKPTNGLVPLEGHLPPLEGFRQEMLHIGPICRYAEDLDVMMKVMIPENSMHLVKQHQLTNVRKIRLFYMEGLRTPFAQSVSSECGDALMRAVQFFETKYDICAIRLDLPFVHYAVELFFSSMEVPGAPSFAHYMTDLKSEVDCIGELMKWFCGNSRHTLPAIVTGILDRQSPFNEEHKEKLVSSRERLNRELKQLLQDDGILIFPTFPTTVPYHNQPLLTPFNFIYTALFNTLSLPVIQCPMGLNKNGLPLGFQMVTSPFNDFILIQLAKHIQSGFGGWKPASD